MSKRESKQSAIDIESFMAPPEHALLHAGRAILTAIGEDVTREGLLRTPQRFAKAFGEMCSGYGMTAVEAVGEGIFSAEGTGLVAVRDVDFHSLCEHHVLPFWGRVSVAYYPRDKILGLSKIPRLVDCFARRLQVQERLTADIAAAINEVVAPRAVAVKVVAEHMCMRMRGVEKTHGTTATETLLGASAIDAAETARLWAALT